MRVKNFYIDATIDGHKTHLKGGPASKTGGLSIVITQRDKGKIIEAFKIECREEAETLFTTITCNGEYIAEVKTER